LAHNGGSIFAELKRRNVYRVAIAYVIASWLFLQVLELIVSLAGAPDWIGKLFLGLLLLGLPIVLLLSWVYELTPEGIKREKDVERETSITPRTGSRLDKMIIGIFFVAVIWIVADRTILTPDASPQRTAEPAAHNEIVATEVIDKSVAVLPFMNMSEDKGAGHFSDGLADTVLHKLAQIDSLRVVARNSSFQFRGQNVDIREVAEKLNVATVLEGSVQAAGDKIRVTAQLIQAETGFHLWSGNFDRQLDDVFAIQDEIAEKVVSALQVSLGDEDVARLAQRNTDSVEAFREYSLALREMDEFSFESLPRAMEHLDKALNIDPGYAIAWASKGLTYRLMAWVGLITSDQFAAAGRPAVEKALELDPEQPLALAVLGQMENMAGNTDEARRLLEKAVALAPGNAAILNIYSFFERDHLNIDKALESALKALELDPLSITSHQEVAMLLQRLDRDEEVLELAARMQVINPAAAVGWWVESYSHAPTGAWAEAVMSMHKAHLVDPSDPITAFDMAYNMMALGLQDAATAWLQKTREIDPGHPVAKAALIGPLLGAETLSEDNIRLARKMLIEQVPDANGVRSVAFAILLREANRSGYFDEYLAWTRHFEPKFFAADIDNVDDDPDGAMFIGRTMELAGHPEQGQRLIALALARIEAIAAAFQNPPSYDHFYRAAYLGDRQQALEFLVAIGETMDLGELNRIYDTRYDPWIRDYWQEPAFQALVEGLEAHAEEQRQLLLKLNGGKYPMPR
jgi:TolB-like protein